MMPINNIFSFSNNIFNRLLSSGSIKPGIVWINGPSLNKALVKAYLKKDRMHVTSISHFPSIFSILLETNPIILAAFNMSSAKGFMMNDVEILSPKKGLTLKRHSCVTNCLSQRREKKQSRKSLKKRN